MIFLVVLAGCSAGSVQALPDEHSNNKALTSQIKAGEYPPLQVEMLPPLVDDGPIFYAPPPDFSAKPIALPRWIDDNTYTNRLKEARSCEGYRIQLYSGRDKAESKRIEEDALNRSGLSVYLTYEAPQFKVRVGNYPDREQAMLECNKLKQIGFPQAWVVRTTIMVQQ